MYHYVTYICIIPYDVLNVYTTSLTSTMQSQCKVWNRLSSFSNQRSFVFDIMEYIEEIKIY